MGCSILYGSLTNVASLAGKSSPLCRLFVVGDAVRKVKVCGVRQNRTAQIFFNVFFP